MRPKRVLYIQHASSLGGSCVSLATTLRALDRSRFEPVIAVANDSVQVARFYESTGFTPRHVPELPFWNHTTGGVTSVVDPRTWLHVADIAASWAQGKRATLQLVDAVKPDLVHLNSVVLSASASALHDAGIPYVWHVREHPPGDGVRTRLLGRLLRRAGDRAVFISHADRCAWGVDGQGHVIHNFVHPTAFESMDRAAARAAFGVPDAAPVIAYVGGLSKIKGILPLVDALPSIVRAVPGVRVLMPSAVYHPPASWTSRAVRRLLPLVGTGTVGQQALERLNSAGLDRNCVRLEFQTDLRRVYAAADVLVFPAVAPHFARPVIEAAAAGVPAIASSLNGMDELVDDGTTGVLVSPGDSRALAETTVRLLRSPRDLHRMGASAMLRARERFDARQAVTRIMALYDEVLGARPDAPPYAQAV